MNTLARKISAVLLGGLLWGIAVPAGTASRQLVLPVATPGTDRTVAMGYTWDDAWLEGEDSGYAYNHGLARVAGAIMSTVYLQPHGKLTGLLSALGCSSETVRDYHYAAMEPEFPHKSGYTFAWRRMENGEPLVIVAIRGTNGRQEWLSNLDIADATGKKQRYHEGFERSAMLVLHDLALYLREQGLDIGQAHFLITGHSRGAAVANLVGAFLDRGEWDYLTEERGRANPGHLAVYAFASPNSCTDMAERKAGLYRNIYNIVNPEDAIPELPFRGGSWDYGSFGLEFRLPSAEKLRGDPQRYEQLVARMSVPFAELSGGQRFVPMPRSEAFARGVKNLQWLVGSVEHFYTSRGKLGHDAIEKVMRRTIPVEDDDRKPELDEGRVGAVQRRYPREVNGATDMHAPATYNAWILAGEPEEIYMRGTPTVVRVSAVSVDGQEPGISLLQDRLPFFMEVSVPGGSPVAGAGDDGVWQARSEMDPELKLTGGRTASFVIPEGERLVLELTAGQQPVELTLSTRLEANAENGLPREEKIISEQLLRLQQGESYSFLITGRKPVKVK